MIIYEIPLFILIQMFSLLRQWARARVSHFGVEVKYLSLRFVTTP